MRERLVFGISPGFPELSRCQGQVTHVLLTRSPLGTTGCCHQVGLARLACVKHAASVRPEPGSNSPSEIVEILRRTRRWRRRRRLRSHLDSTPSRTSRLTILPETSSERMDGTRDQPGAARAGSSDLGGGEGFALIWTRRPRGRRGSPSSPRRARREWTAPGTNPVPLVLAHPESG